MSSLTQRIVRISLLSVNSQGKMFIAETFQKYVPRNTITHKHVAHGGDKSTAMIQQTTNITYRYCQARTAKPPPRHYGAS